MKVIKVSLLYAGIQTHLPRCLDSVKLAADVDPQSVDGFPHPRESDLKRQLGTQPNNLEPPEAPPSPA